LIKARNNKQEIVFQKNGKKIFRKKAEKEKIRKICLQKLGKLIFLGFFY